MPISAHLRPRAILLERNGDLFTLSASGVDGVFQPVGSMTVSLGDPVYVGLAVCSHDAAREETGVFSDVQLKNTPPVAEAERVLESMLEIVAIETGRRRIVHRARDHFEAPNWSPDGKTLAYCAERKGEYDVYTIGIQGGPERRLTTAAGLDDGPEYSPDGRYIYLNSVRSGLMKIWRMGPDGRQQEQVTFGAEYADWFAHPSPDGKWLVFLSYDKSVEGHPANKQVTLRLMPTAGGDPRVLAHLFGGQGTINVPSWSPDSKHVAFVSYRLVAPDNAAK